MLKTAAYDHVLKNGMLVNECTTFAGTLLNNDGFKLVIIRARGLNFNERNKKPSV